jgi:hypothetical protein
MPLIRMEAETNITKKALHDMPGSSAKAAARISVVRNGAVHTPPPAPILGITRDMDSDCEIWAIACRRRTSRREMPTSRTSVFVKSAGS